MNSTRRENTKATLCPAKGDAAPGKIAILRKHAKWEKAVKKDIKLRKNGEEQEKLKEMLSFIQNLRELVASIAVLKPPQNMMPPINPTKIMAPQANRAVGAQNQDQTFLINRSILQP